MTYLLRGTLEWTIDHIFMKINLFCASWQDQDTEVEISKSAFVELVQMLLNDKHEKDKFFKVSSALT